MVTRSTRSTKRIGFLLTHLETLDSLEFTYDEITEELPHVIKEVRTYFQKV